MITLEKFYRELTPLSDQDCFLVFDREKSHFGFPVHYHPEYEINFIENGKGCKRVVGDNIEEIDDLELVLVGPNLNHGWETHKCKNKNIHEITIQFHNDLFSNSLLSRRIMKPIREMFERSAYGIYFSQQTALAMRPRLLKLNKLNGFDYFIEIISILNDLSISEDQLLLSTISVNIDTFEKNDKMKYVYEYIQNNFSEKILVEDVAKVVSMSVITFNRFIKKRTGKTFVNYLNEIRIGHASRWLVEKELTVTDVASKVGFNSISNFNKFFKIVKNCTPSKYRNDFSGLKRVL